MRAILFPQSDTKSRRLDKPPSGSVLAEDRRREIRELIKETFEL